MKNNLSAGRVQSVAVRLIAEREREINAFTPQSSFKIEAIFTAKDSQVRQISLKQKDKYQKLKTAEKFLQRMHRRKIYCKRHPGKTRQNVHLLLLSPHLPCNRKPAENWVMV